MATEPEAIDILLEKAHFMHKKGYNCAETVLWTLSCYWHLNCSTSCATGFGGGVARMGETCGALTGAVLALGAKVGRTEPDDDGKKLACYRLGQDVVREFRAHLASTQCRDIIGFVLGSEGGGEKYAAGSFKDGKCKDAIEIAVKAAVHVAEGHR